MIPPAILPDLTRQQMLDAVKMADSPGELKQRIMICLELGMISEDEAEDWIAMTGVQND